MADRTPQPHAAALRFSRECLCSPVRLLHRALAVVYDEALRPHGVTIAQLNLLTAVEVLGQRASASLLSPVLQMEKSSLSRELQQLEGAGWVRRDPAGGRTQRLSLTASGKELLGEVLPAWEAAQRKAAQLLAPEERKRIVGAARRLREEALQAGGSDR